VTCQHYYLIECQHVAVLSARISPLGAGAFRSTLTCESKSSCRTQDPWRPTYSDIKVPVSMEVWLGLVTTLSSWRRRKSQHEGQSPGCVVCSGNSTCPARNKEKGVCRTHEGLPMRYWRKVGMMSSLHGPHGLGHTWATMAMTMGSKAVRRSESGKIASVWIVLCNSGT
jgi:hypothetical protein